MLLLHGVYVKNETYLRTKKSDYYQTTNKRNSHISYYIYEIKQKTNMLKYETVHDKNGSSGVEMTIECLY